MNPFVRWWKFNFVGAIGMVVQLTALSCINRLAPWHYLWSSAIAVELAILNNFVWHIHYTWRDRCRGAAGLRQFVRFHLSNGMVSIAGNLLLMRLFVHLCRLPILAANVIAIVCCSVLNFCLSHKWAFAIEAQRCENHV